jgi:hypothetical protein
MEHNKPSMVSEEHMNPNMVSEEHMKLNTVSEDMKPQLVTRSVDKKLVTDTRSVDKKLVTDTPLVRTKLVKDTPLVHTILEATAKNQPSIHSEVMKHQDIPSEVKTPTEQQHLKSADMGIMMLALLVVLMAVLWVVAISAHTQDLFQWLPSQWLIMESGKARSELFQFESHL